MGLLRFMLAIAVVAYHCGPILGLRMMPGNFAVEVFFAISGFYMAMILTEKYEAAIGTFYLNRFLRLYPTYLIVLLAYWGWFFASWLAKGQMPPTSWVEAYATMDFWPKALIVVSNWTMLGSDALSLFDYSPSEGISFTDFQEAAPGWPQPIGYHRTISQAWTLGMEVWFYLMAPWLMRLGWRIISILGIASLALRFWLQQNVGGYSTMLFFPAQFCWFAVGMLLFEWMKCRRFQAASQSTVRVMLAVMVAVIAGWQWLPVSTHLLVQVGLVLLVPYLFAGTRGFKTMEALGHWSYPIYLVHMLVAAVLAATMKISGGVTVSAAACLLAWLICRFIEQPVEQHRRRLQAGNCLSQPPVTPADTLISQRNIPE
jgi:peptidoglycan/LPS O-acetylase OafA/YrhL